MVKRMLIDATHPEETRVVVIDGNRLEDFDFESATKRQLKGNIYLAKVTRVEPSLQAAFVDYGGGRHGFLAFSEIHPDYYRIPVADREALIAAEAEQARRQDANGEERYGEERSGRRRPRGRRRHEDRRPAAASEEAVEPTEVDENWVAEPPEELQPAPPPELEPLTEDSAEATGRAGGGEPGADESAAERQDKPDGGPAERDEASGGDRPGRTKAADMAQPPRLSTDAVPEEAEPDAQERARSDLAPRSADEQPMRDDIAVAEAGVSDVVAPESGERYGESDATAGSVEAGTAERPADEGAGDVAVAEGPAGDLGGEDQVETLGGDEFEEASRRRARSFRRYKIQEVIKRRQIMLVQVVKEERGTKGAALTTYLSLAGRYCVLMPNTARGGGISRKITNANDRKRLRSVLDELSIPDGMAVIVRTAGSERSKPEVKRDYEYLMRLWDSIREQTLQSTAPALIHEEASLIKRSIRDLYARDIDEITVDGEEGYRAAKDFMRMLMPSHSKRVQPYRDAVPLFQRYQVEAQIDAIHQPVCQLRSGGYIVINQTEALVAIDVNSGRATRERHIEETALKTNLEAADEIARQLRLRDLAGLIVIDFIDMEDHRNNHAVERRFKDAMRFDRARIQIGRISAFGLLELSRQRLRPSLVEASTDQCPHCGGTGRIRSIDSSGLHVLRAIEDEALRGKSSEVAVHVSTPIALYILNQKRPNLIDLEQRYAIRVLFERDDTLIPPAFRIERLRQRQPGERPPQVDMRPGMANIDTEAEAAADAAAEAAAHALDREADEAGHAEAQPAEDTREAARYERSGEDRSDDERQRHEQGGRRRRRRRRGAEHGERGQGERGQGERSQGERGQGERGQGERGQGERGQGERGQGERAHGDRSQGERSQGEREQRAQQPGSDQGVQDDRFANQFEGRRRPEFSRRALPTPAEFEVGGAGMFGRPNFNQADQEDDGAGAGDAQPTGEQSYEGRPAYQGRHAQDGRSGEERQGDDRDGGRKRRRRGRRGGRRRRRGENLGGEGGQAGYEEFAEERRVVPPAALDMDQPAVPEWPRPWAGETPEPVRDARPRSYEEPMPERGPVEPQVQHAPASNAAVSESPAAAERPVRAEPEPAMPARAAAPEDAPATKPTPEPEPEIKGDLLGEPGKQPRKGWWRRTLGG
ncbi:MAG: Rne/Rng family ribonuclease [Alphaproteobacteria bacterium]|nr:Rne/Rng family ribonuclease [Alphaproteobacteria bacterium]